MPDRSRRWPSRTSLTTAGEGPARLTQDGRLLVRVYGRCHGLVTCEGRRLWTWGPFAHVFAVPAEAGSVTVRALGLLGVRRVRVQLDPVAELREPRVASIAPPAPSPRATSLARARAVTHTPAVKVALPSLCATALPVPPLLHSRAPSPFLRTPTLALRLPRPGENR